MEDSKISEPPHHFNIQKLKKSISELEYDPQGQYFALSVDFLNHPQKYANAVPSTPTNNINSQLYEGNSPFSCRIKQALRFSIDYVAIDYITILEIQLNYNCSRIKIGRDKNLGQRWIIYKEMVSYFKIWKQRIQSQDQSQTMICKRIEVFPYNNLEDIRLIIFKNQNLPDYYRGQLWIFIGQFPNTPSKLRQKLGQRNNLLPYSMLINDPEIFKLKRKYKQFTIILESQQQKAFLPLEIKCFYHHYKSAHYVCICKHERSFVCDRLCYQDNAKHNKRCIYVPKKQQCFNGEPSKIKKEQHPQRRVQPGLYNQRNMCFFNTIIQCLAHIKKLTRYFLQKNQFKQLNYWNNDGTFGQIAQQYGNFIRKFNDQASDKCHMSFFMTVGRWNPSYANKNQHDSHEFLIKILDWLKQDLNANQLKPIYKHIQNENKDQEQLILQTEAIHKARNDSIIEKIMQGVQRSVIKCTFCNYSSLTFDYFLTIQLPMARETKVQIPIKQSFIYYVSTSNQQKIKKFKLLFHKDETIQGLKRQVRSVIVRANDYEFQFYKVSAQSAEIIKNDDFYTILSVPQSRSQVIFCVQKYKIGYGRQTIPVNLVFRDVIDGLPPFCRPIFIPNVMEVQIIYIRILGIIMKCKKIQSDTIVQNYFQTYFETSYFPFQLILKNPKEEQIVITRKKQYKKYYFQPGSMLYIKVLNKNDFNFPKLNTYVSINTQSTKQMKNKSTVVSPKIEDCLKLYCKKQQIQDGRWYCSKCKMKRPATKTLFFEKLPNIVILSINRFKQIYSPSSYTTQFFKNENLIEYGPQLNMGRFTQNQKQQRYRLFAVANHLRIDESLKDVREMDGHYYAAIKTDKGWLRFDDEDVTITTEQKVLNNKHAYILFYQKIKQE